jgi:hypothetical protein
MKRNPMIFISVTWIYYESDVQETLMH